MYSFGVFGEDAWIETPCNTTNTFVCHKITYNLCNFSWSDFKNSKTYTVYTNCDFLIIFHSQQKFA